MMLFAIDLCIIAGVFVACAPFFFKIMQVSEGQRAEKHQAEVNHLNAKAERERLESENLTSKLKEMRGSQQSK